MPPLDESISKRLSLVLRHDPDAHGVVLDAEGWARIADLLAALRRLGGDWSGVAEADIRRVVSTASKSRHEIDGDRIRARYGHSIGVRRGEAPAVPPAILYHGTSRSAWAAIERTGIKPMGRDAVHLSSSSEAARSVGLRKDRRPVVVEVHALQAYERAQVQFWRLSESLWLAGSAIGPEFVAQWHRDE